MKAFIIGGTGLMGPFLVRELEAAGHKTTCFNRRGIHPSNGNSIKGNRDDDKSLRSAIFDFRPDVIFDMIPYTEGQALGLRKILDEIKCALIACSSIDVYRAYNILHRLEKPPYQVCPIKESGRLRSRLSMEGTKYDKLNVERQYLSLNTDVTIFRLPAIYGWPDKRRVKGYVDQIQRNGKVVSHPMEVNWRFSRSLNENCAFALSLGLDREGKHIFNVSEPKAYTEEEWCRKIARHLDWNEKIVIDEYSEYPLDLKQDWYVDSQLIREELGYYEKYDCDDGLRRNIVKYLESEQDAGGND